MAPDGELWHVVEARRDDGNPAMFRIRELAPRLDQPNIFVIEMPYATGELSRLPDAPAYRRLDRFEEQWLTPACATLGWTFVASKADAGSFFLYLYGAGEPGHLIERLSPFDPALGFFDEHDPTWDEYGALRELLDQAQALPKPALAATTAPRAKPASKPTTARIARPVAAKQKPAAKKSAAKKKPGVKKKPVAKSKPTAKKKPAAKKR